MLKAYLFLYNAVSALAWAYCLYLAVVSYHEGLAPEAFWARAGKAVQITQSMAALEIMHSLLGMVRSPFMTTFMQVNSRLLLVWGYSSFSPLSQAHWSLYLMVGSWSLVEVPRYLFYAFNLVMKKVPFPLFYLRYSLFAVLYPSGISGELLQMWSSLPYYRTALPAWRLFTYFVFLVYVPAGPFMYFHMVVQRKKAFRSRTQGPRVKRAPSGLVFPVTDEKKGKRSTSHTNQQVWANSIKAIDEDMYNRVLKEKVWRFGYEKHVVSHVERCCDSAEDALKVARAGLDYVYDTFEFIRDGKSCSLKQAMDGRYADSFHTGFIQGERAKPREGFELEVPYKGKVLKGQALLKQLDAWVAYGTIEPSCRDAIARVAKNPSQLDLSDSYFVLLGAGSAMGPLLVLMALGANVIAVDLDREQIWQRLTKIARESCGTMTFPLSKPQKGLSQEELCQSAGCNLFTQTPEIRNWLVTVNPDKALTIGGYAYLDGALHVQVSLAMDAIMSGVYSKRKNIGLGFLCSPTDVFVLPEDAHAAMEEAYANAPLWQKLCKLVGLGPKKNARKIVGSGLTVVNGLVGPQGPNYALAKRIQHWRAMVARDEGCVVSTNIAPSTATKSVTSNKLFAIAYAGMNFFKPMEVFYQETSNAVMGALLIHDVRNTKGAAFPRVPLKTPLQLFGFGACHGGIWRMAYEMGSIGNVTFLAGFMRIYGLVFSALLAAAAGAAYHVQQNGLPFELP